MQKSTKRLIIEENLEIIQFLFKIFFNSIKNKKDILDNKIM